MARRELETTTMIWHIFKKDVRLLWPLVAGAAALHFAHAAAQIPAGRRCSQT
jgi:hypothetical protein